MFRVESRRTLWVARSLPLTVETTEDLVDRIKDTLRLLIDPEPGYNIVDLWCPAPRRRRPAHSSPPTRWTPAQSPKARRYTSGR